MKNWRVYLPSMAISSVILFALALVVIVSLTACTEQQMAKQYGGTANIHIQQGEKLVMITWKADNLWILTRPMTDADKAETYTFKESSSYGIIQGKIIITEKK